MKTFKDYRSELVAESELILESLDKPFEKNEIYIHPDELKQIASNGAEDYHEYALHDGRQDIDTGNPTVMTVYKRNGAYEIHHPLHDGTSGEMVSTGKSNPRFVATMFNRAKELIDQGHSVRIVGHVDNGMFDHYHRIAKALARRNNYVISRPQSYTVTSQSPVADEYNEFLVSKKLNESIGTRLSSVVIHNGKKSGQLQEIHQMLTYIRGSNENI